jgi:hypothetical protein
MKQHITLKNTRLVLFLSLTALAPFSKYPSFETPLYNFSSFRLGFYQILAAIFVILCAVPTLKKLNQLYSQNKLVFISLIILALTVTVGVFGAIYKLRSVLLIVSVLFLISLVFASWWYIKYEFSKKYYRLAVKILLFAGIFFSVVGIAQFIFATFGDLTFGVLCKNCSEVVFGFPRINGFAAEPQFYANAMLPFFFISLGVAYLKQTKISYLTLGLVSLAITLTFSRGAFLAVVTGLFAYLLLLIYCKKLIIKKIVLLYLLVLVVFTVGLGSLIASAIYRHKQTTNIAYNTTVSTIDHLTLGIINLPEKIEAPQESKPELTNQTTNFTPPGLIETSTTDRTEAAKLALKSWSNNTFTTLFGVGAGNLGPYAVKNIQRSAPSDLTVYIYYVLILAELGLIGLLAFLTAHIASLWSFTARYKKHKLSPVFLAMAALLIAFGAQYVFFGTYINTVYVWLWLGIIIGFAGLSVNKTRYNQR